jgi:alkylation response protein AidB-like acyl-CoA dehydrogenase
MSSPFLEELSRHARQADEEAVWPEASWECLKELGALRWAIPRAYGGDGYAGPDLLERYESVAGACLTTAFILSQRDAAVRRLCDSGNDRLCREILPILASGRHFATVGVAQLTTSRQYGRPAVVARRQGDDFIIDGTIPWVTGASQADYIIIGAVMDEGQILAVLPGKSPGVQVSRAMALMALQGSLTAEIRCEGVGLERQWLLAGPVQRVMPVGKGSAGGLETSCLALGLAGAAIRHIFAEAARREDLADDARRLESAMQGLRQDLFRIARDGVTADGAQSLRTRANTLVLQATQAALTASKGTGFLRDHPAQRWARQALFFLVWSCPSPVAAAHMAQFTQVCSEPDA